MTDQDQLLNTNPVSPSMEDILSNKAPVEPKKDTDEQTKAAEKPVEAEKPEESKPDSEVEKLQKRLQDTQKWGNTQREAALRIIKNLREKGLSDEDIAETLGGQEIYEKVVKGVPAEQELGDKDSVAASVYNKQIATVADAMIEMGSTKEELEEYVQAYNALASTNQDHRDEVYRRATSGEGNVAAYVIKVGKELIDEYRLSKEMKIKGVKNFEAELREKIRAELLAEISSSKEAVKQELGELSGKPRLVGGSPNTEKTQPAKDVDFKHIFGR